MGEPFPAFYEYHSYADILTRMENTPVGLDNDNTYSALLSSCFGEEFPIDTQERPTRNPKHVTCLEDIWDFRESIEADTQADSSDSSEISEGDTLSETHPFRRHVPTICKAGLDEFWGLVTTAGNPETSNAGKGPSFTSSGHSSETPGWPGNSRKRRVCQDSNDQEDQEGQPNGKKPRLQEASNEDGPTLACPFYKHNPAKHSNCLHFRLKRIKDVKQHLQRKHKQPHYCPICGLQFGTQASLQVHTRSRSCEDVIYTVPEGVSEDQRAKLGDRVARTQTLSEQWYTIWDIVFPETLRPESPLVESPIHEVLSHFREFWEERGQELISEHLHSREIPYSLPREERDLNALHTLLLHESMGELINRFMDRFSNPPTSPIPSVPPPSSNEVAGCQLDHASDEPFRSVSGNTLRSTPATQSSGGLTVPNLVNDLISDPSSQSSRPVNTFHTDANGNGGSNVMQQVPGTRPENLDSFDGNRWTAEWMENQGNSEDSLGNSVLGDFDFDSFLQGGDNKGPRPDGADDFAFC